MRRRAAALFLGLAVMAPGAAAFAQEDAGFAGFVASLRPAAMAAGIAPTLFDQVFAAMAPDPTVAAMARRQPEFAKPLGVYLAGQVTPARVAQGKALLARWAGPLAMIERRYGVPRSILVAIWGLETNYGASAGTKDVIRSMATLGALGVRTDLYRGEVLAALELLQRGEATRAQLHGSWAGAMGQPQFMPSSYAAYAVDGDGDGRRDIWADVPDALASIANFLKAKGWQAGRPWGAEVTLPKGFALGQSRADYADWAAKGFKPVAGGALPARGEAVLFFPAGATGPAFLVTANTEVLKTYNFSDAYVLSVADLADRMEGRAPITGPWPTDPQMSREARIALQARLAALGYPVDSRDGRFSLALRDTIVKAQQRVGLVPDGNPTDALLKALGP